ncbi:MAG TPA: type II secretion system F family protein [Stellaceae bacterium]|jgi:tight adherence protein B|nr:type II secretion system F family protein [Stellaceae bacterium]
MIDSIMSGSIDSDVLLWVLAGVLGLTVLSVAFAFGGDEPGAKRVQRVRARARGQGGDEQVQEVILRLDQKRNNGLDSMVRNLLPRPELLRLRLLRTGWSMTLGTYAMMCGVTAVFFGGLFFYFDLMLAIAVPAAIVLGLLLPHLVVSYACHRRAKKFTAQFPDAIGLMVRGIKSGLPIAETFVVVAQEVPDPVGMEFRRVSDQIRLGQQMDQALWDCAKRVDTPEIKFLVVSLSVQKETGGNLAETLENLETVLRRRRQMKLKVRAMASEARASAAIIGSLPFITMAILSGINRPYIARLFETELGNKMLLGAAFAMSAGIYIMQKMAKFEI